MTPENETPLLPDKIMIRSLPWWSRQLWKNLMVLGISSTRYSIWKGELHAAITPPVWCKSPARVQALSIELAFYTTSPSLPTQHRPSGPAVLWLQDVCIPLISFQASSSLSLLTSHGRGPCVRVQIQIEMFTNISIQRHPNYSDQVKKLSSFLKWQSIIVGLCVMFYVSVQQSCFITHHTVKPVKTRDQNLGGSGMRFNICTAVAEAVVCWRAVFIPSPPNIQQKVVLKCNTSILKKYFLT